MILFYNSGDSFILLQQLNLYRTNFDSFYQKKKQKTLYYDLKKEEKRRNMFSDESTFKQHCIMLRLESVHFVQRVLDHFLEITYQHIVIF